MITNTRIVPSIKNPEQQTPLSNIDRDMIEKKKKELYEDMNMGYAGYKEILDDDRDKIVEYFRKYGIKVANLRLLMDIRSKMTGMDKFYGLGVGPLIGMRKADDMESTATHETIHVTQYRENSPVLFVSNYLKARLGFIAFGIIKQGPIINKMEKERKKYGKRAAAQYATKNAPMEFEAFLHEGDTLYLETREPFAYKKYETKEGRSAAIMTQLNNDILKRIEKIKGLLALIEDDQDISEYDAIIINETIDQMAKEILQIEAIKKEHGNDDRELVGTMESAKGVLCRAEPKRLVMEKRLPLLEKFIEKERKFKSIIKKYRNIEIISHKEDEDENGIIMLTAKDGDNEKMIRTLEADPEIQMLDPNIYLKDYKLSRKRLSKKNQNPTCAWVSFTR